MPLVPIALATGWSALILFAIGIPLNPMSATLGALVIAISTEFSVLLSERFRQERAAGHDAAGRRSRARTAPPAPRCSRPGSPRSPGSACWCFSSITMLRDFGFVTLIDLTVSLAACCSCCRRCSWSPSASRGRGARAAFGRRAARAAAAAAASPGRVSEPPPGPRSRTPAAGEASPRAPRSTRTGPSAAARWRPRGRASRRPVIDTRPYRWTIGIFGLVLVIAISVYQFVTHGVGTAGCPPGKRLHYFVAPLATATLNGDANLDPRCDPAHPDPRR